MGINFDRNKILWVLGTIVLGALGSGLWDIAVKPAMVFMVNFLIDVILGAFGNKQDSIYKEIASLNREITGRFILSFGMGLLAGSISFILLRFFRIQGGNDRETTPPSKYFVALFGIFVFVFLTFTVGKTSYVISKQDNYLQLKRIVLPYLSHEEGLKLDAEFSMISTSKAYDELMNTMKKVASANQITIPSQIK